MSPGIQDQPGQHSKIPSQNKQKSPMFNILLKSVINVEEDLILCSTWEKERKGAQRRSNSIRSGMEKKMENIREGKKRKNILQKMTEGLVRFGCDKVLLIRAVGLVGVL